MKMNKKVIIILSAVGIVAIATAITATTGGQMSFEEAFAKKNAARKAAYQKKFKKEKPLEWNSEIQARQLQEKYGKKVDANIKRVEEVLANPGKSSDQTIMYLGWAKDIKAIPVLKKVLEKDICAKSRQFAVVALQTIGDHSVIPALQKALEDKDQRVKVAAAIALAKFNQINQAFPTLRDTALKKGIENWIIDFNGEAGKKYLLKNRRDVQSKTKSLPSKALRALGEIGDEKSIEVVRQSLNDKVTYVRFISASILLKKNDKKRALPVLEAIILDSNTSSTIRPSAIGVVVQSKGWQEKKLIKQLLNSRNSIIVQETEKAIQRHKDD
ncbi:HEAT repeat domain-containing protein [bacterium]|nr:HEAT repeat domain-containing protein [bacterium]